MARFYRVKNALIPTQGPANAVFIWIPKNAGTSTFDVLRRESGFLKLKRMPDIQRSFKQKGRVSFAHIGYQSLKESGYVEDEFDRSAFKFCFVRDPYERAVSLYRYLIKDERFEKPPTFLEFCHLLQTETIEPVGLYNYLGLSQCNPQVRWLDGLSMDFIGRYETLEVDFKTLAEKFGITGPLPDLNRAFSQDVGDYYCAESKAIIETVYKEDFESLGYQIRDEV